MNDEKAPTTTVGALPMSGAELRCLREWLGLTTRWLADHLDVAERSVHRWESGAYPVPAGVASEVLRLSEITYDVLNGIGGRLFDLSDPEFWLAPRDHRDLLRRGARGRYLSSAAPARGPRRGGCAPVRARAATPAATSGLDLSTR